MIVKGQRGMIDSLLDRPQKRIQIDRVVKSIEEEEEELLNEPKEVLEEVRRHFAEQFRKWSSMAENLLKR